MSIVHIPFYPSDWLAGTAALSDAEKGVYITLIARMYEMAGPIERDDNRLYRVCGSKSKASFVKALEYLISEGKIIVTGEGLFNEKASKVIEQTTEKSTKAKAAAQSRWDRKSNKNNGRGNANASPEHMPEECQPKPEPKLSKRDTNVSPKNGTRLPDDWFLSASLGQWSIEQGATVDLVRAEADKFKDYWKGVAGAKGRKADWDATWRNWIRKAIADVQPKFKAITGGHNGQSTNKSEQRVSSFVSGAAGSS